MDERKKKMVLVSGFFPGDEEFHREFFGGLSRIVEEAVSGDSGIVVVMTTHNSDFYAEHRRKEMEEAVILWVVAIFDDMVVSSVDAEAIAKAAEAGKVPVLVVCQSARVEVPSALEDAQRVVLRRDGEDIPHLKYAIRHLVLEGPGLVVD